MIQTNHNKKLTSNPAVQAGFFISTKMTFEKFYNQIGFEKYPFSTFTTENELDKLQEIFVEPTCYSPIKESIDSGATAFIYGERGIGKTALLQKIIKSKEPIEIDNYSKVPTNSSAKDFYDLLTNHLAQKIIIDLSKKPISRLFLNHEEKTLVSYLIRFNIEHTTLDIAYKNIRAIQHPPIKRAGIFLYNSLRSILNQITSTAVDVMADTVAKHLNLVSTNNFETRDYFKALNIDAIKDPEESPENYHILEKSLKLYRKINDRKVIFSLDKIDEDARFDNDAEKISEFIKPLFTDTKLLLNTDIQILISVWTIPFNKVLPYFRKNKFCCEEIHWTYDELAKLINTRLSNFSNKKINNIEDILGNKSDFQKLWNISNGNPRDLIQALNKIFREQYKENQNSELISESAIKNGITEFVKNFSFYEYYPKKSNARANSMDIYSYINHLLKLDSSKFTNNSLSEKASTGSSTSNYIVGMEAIGLVIRCDEKGPNGSTLYQIRDPKVIHALKEKIEIRRER